MPSLELIVQELFPSPLWNSADYQLPTPAFAERAGSFVNCDHRLQSVDWAIRPPAGVYTDGQLYWRLLNRTGLFQADVVRRELAADIGYFTLASEEIPLDGVCLTLNHLATESTMVDSA